MTKESKKKKFISKPYYPGGTRALGQFVRKHLKYPEEAKQQGIEGVVRIKIAIDYKGKVVGHEIISSLGHGCDEEAWRICQLLEFKIDQKLRRGKIRFHKTMNVHFHLPKAKKKSPSAVKYHYQITSSKTTNEKKKREGYSYTVEW